ncbi:MAG: GWxTD domain-containing protein [Candidatus Kapaibacterium sp.]
MNRILIVLLLLVSSSLLAQIDKSKYYSYGESLFSEVLELPYSNPDSAKIVILAKAANEALRFQKVKDGPNFGKYFGVLDVEILFQNSDGIVKNRSKISDTIYFKEYEQTLSKSIYVEGTKEIIVPRGKFDLEIKFDIKDNSYLSTKKHSIDVSKKPELYTPLLFNTQRSDVYTELQPFALNQTISFDAQGAKILIPAENLEEANYTYNLIKKKDVSEIALKWDSKNEVNGICKVINNVDFSFTSNYSDVKFDLKRNRNYNVLDIDLPGIKVIPGIYSLEIIKNNEKLTDFDISIEWVSQPISLNKLPYAIEILKYIATDAEIEKINSSDDVSATFLDYWKAKDPTPSTPFNEALQQYYMRVDYAFFNFKTISEDDGAKTDRGKIYVLKSAPSEVKEDFIDDRTLIIWKYPSQKKEYIFELIGAGDYRLIEIKEI